MAEVLSNRELLGAFKGKDDKLKEDLITQPSNAETFLNTLRRGATGLYSNVDNLTGNLADLLGQKEDTNILNKFSEIQSDPRLNEAEKAIESGKAYFDKPTTKGGISQLLDFANPEISEALMSGREQAEFKHQEYLTKQDAVGQHSTGSFGDMAGEMFLATPIMKFGNMAKTSVALKESASGLNTAKAIAIDSVKNAGVLSSTELLLGKAYGKSDDEAIQNAVMAGAIGLLGTPIVGGAMKGGNALIKGEAKLEGELAGGGVPTRQQQADLDARVDVGFDEPASSVAEAVKARKEKLKTKSGRPIESEQVAEGKKAVEDIEFDVVEPKAEASKVLADNEFVPEVNNPKKFRYGYDDRGRVYTEEASALGPQGGATQKATLQQRAKPKI